MPTGGGSSGNFRSSTYTANGADMDGFWIMLGLIALGFAIDNGLNNIARALGLKFKSDDGDGERDK